MASALSQKLRELATRLRKEAGSSVQPKPLPNPTASRAAGDIGTKKPAGLGEPKTAGDNDA
jgi:hypothetical protein